MSEEELVKHLSGNGAEVKEEEEVVVEKPVEKPVEESPFKKVEETIEKVIEGDPDARKIEEAEKKVEEEEEKKVGETKEVEAEVQYTNMVDYLNKEHDLGLNVKNLPDDLTREQEAEVVSDLFQRTLTGVNRKLEEYAGIEEVLKDKEVKDFIAAKAGGKSLKDYVSEYAETTDGQSNENIIKNQLSTQYPEMTKEEISDMVGIYKDKGILDKMADSSRESQKAAAIKKDEIDTATQETNRNNEIQQFGGLVKGTESVYGIPLTDQIKSDVFVAVTQRGEDNLTYMDRMLQSDEGMFLAALGVLHMQDMMQAKATTDTNRRNKTLVDKLFTDASDLQSKTEDDTEKEGFNAEIADRF
jgi:hypothetical protein